MDKKNNDLALIAKLAERASTDKNFCAALEKLSDLRSQAIAEFVLNNPPDYRGKESVLHLISYPRILTLESLKGDEFLSEECRADIETKYGIKRWLPRKAAEPTNKTHIRVDETFGNATFMQTFKSLPGTWAHKCLTWNQFVSFLRKYPTWVNQNGITHFLIKKDELKEVDEAHPQDNLYSAYLYATMKKTPIYANIECNEIDRQTVYPNPCRVVSPSRLDAYLVEDYKRKKKH